MKTQRKKAATQMGLTTRALEVVAPEVAKRRAPTRRFLATWLAERHLMPDERGLYFESPASTVCYATVDDWTFICFGEDSVDACCEGCGDRGAELADASEQEVLRHIGEHLLDSPDCCHKDED